MRLLLVAISLLAAAPATPSYAAPDPDLAAACDASISERARYVRKVDMLPLLEKIERRKRRGQFGPS